MGEDKAPPVKPLSYHDLYERYMKKVTNGFIEMNSDVHKYEHVIWEKGLEFSFSEPIRPNPDDATEYNQELSLRYLQTNTMTFALFKDLMEAGKGLALSFADLPKVRPLGKSEAIIGYLDQVYSPTVLYDVDVIFDDTALRSVTEHKVQILSKDGTIFDMFRDGEKISSLQMIDDFPVKFHIDRIEIDGVIGQEYGKWDLKPHKP